MTAFIYIVLILAGLLVTYLFVIRPWHIHWGATKQEIKRALPGDSRVQTPDFNATRGITIQSTPALIWRWIIQIGSKRAGWYSIDWMDNAGIKSSEKILPAFQTIEIGQFIPFTPDQKNGMWVDDFREHEYILWVDKAGKATWLWYVYPVNETSSRLVTRLRTKYNWKGIWIIYYILYDMGDIIMMRKCMKGLKRRAENEFNIQAANSK
jgi:hypothetical protein